MPGFNVAPGHFSEIVAYRVEQLVDRDPGCGFLGGHSDFCLSGARQAVSHEVASRSGGIVGGICRGN